MFVKTWYKRVRYEQLHFTLRYIQHKFANSAKMHSFAEENCGWHITNAKRNTMHATSANSPLVNSLTVISSSILDKTLSFILS